MRRATKKSSKKAGVFLLALILIALVLFFIFKHKTAVAPATTSTPIVTSSQSISITEVPISEKYYSGSRPIIAGSGALADAARKYLDTEIANFAQEANDNVPLALQQPDVDPASAQYTIDIKGEYKKGDKYSSIILNEYLYTGGANGASTYKVFTADNATGTIISLQDIIAPSQQANFLAYVKQKLLAYQPADDDSDNSEPVVFKDSVDKLTFSSLTDWSIDDSNLTLYFDQYAVAPGAIGAIALDLPQIEIVKFLK